MQSYRARVDRNEAEIIKALRAIKCSVVRLAAVGRGVPDLLVSKAGRTLLIEVKTQKGKLNELQEKFVSEWKGEVHTCRSPIDAVNAVLNSAS